jgi:hypothetical protein
MTGRETCQVDGCGKPAQWVQVQVFPDCENCRRDLDVEKATELTIYLCRYHGNLYRASCSIYSDLKRLQEVIQ